MPVILSKKSKWKSQNIMPTKINDCTVSTEQNCRWLWLCNTSTVALETKEIKRKPFQKFAWNQATTQKLIEHPDHKST